MAIIVYHERFNNHDVYTVNIQGTEIKVTVTVVASVVRKWIYATLLFCRRDLQQNRSVVGLGVQWTPGGRDPPADTLQLCIGRRCLIFQLGYTNYIPRILRKLLKDPDFTFVGFWNHSDRRKMESSEHRLEMYRDPLDLRHYTDGEDEYEDLALASVVEIIFKCLGYEMVPELRSEIGKSDWDDEDLSHEQIVYACVDAYCAFLIGKKIEAWKYK